MTSRLLDAAQEFGDQSQESRAKIFEALGTSQLVVPANRPNGGSAIQLGFAIDGRGRRYLPSFTGIVQLRSWLPEASYASAQAMDVVRAVIAGPFQGLGIDAGSKWAVFLHRDALENLLSTGDIGAVSIDPAGVERLVLEIG